MNPINFHWILHWILVVSIVLLLLRILNKTPRSTWTDESFSVDDSDFDE